MQYGIPETCVDAVRKQRKKATRRGPYTRPALGNTVWIVGCVQSILSENLHCAVASSSTDTPTSPRDIALVNQPKSEAMVNTIGDGSLEASVSSERHIPMLTSSTSALAEGNPYKGYGQSSWMARYSQPVAANTNAVVSTRPQAYWAPDYSHSERSTIAAPYRLRQEQEYYRPGPQQSLSGASSSALDNQRQHRFQPYGEPSHAGRHRFPGNEDPPVHASYSFYQNSRGYQWPQS